MGLDMYLSNKRYMSKYFDKEDSARIAAVNDVFGLTGDEDGDYGAKEVTFSVAYWRKANAIHAWFVKNVQDGKDECRETFVAREQLAELVDTCKKVLENRSLAMELLPPQSGFFFGGTDIDEWYVQDLEQTVERLEKVLAEPTFSKGDFYYQSSW